jgi:hypothetical protein
MDRKRSVAWISGAALARSSGLRSPGTGRCEQLCEIDVEGVCNAHKGVNCGVRATLFDPCVVGRQHSQTRGERLLRLAPLAAQFLDPKPERLQDSFGFSGRHRPKVLWLAQQKQSRIRLDSVTGVWL